MCISTSELQPFQTRILVVCRIRSLPVKPWYAWYAMVAVFYVRNIPQRLAPQFPYFPYFPLLKWNLGIFLVFFVFPCSTPVAERPKTAARTRLAATSSKAFWHSRCWAEDGLSWTQLDGLTVKKKRRQGMSLWRLKKTDAKKSSGPEVLSFGLEEYHSIYPLVI